MGGDDGERTKATVYRSHTFFTVYAVQTLTPRDDPGFGMDEVSQRFDELGGQEYGVGALIHGLLDVVVDGHFDAVQALDDGIESLQDARLNTVMKKLTAWAAIIAVPTAITGFYGQHVTYPGISTVTGFVTSSAVIVLLVAVLYVMFRRRDWL